MGIKGLIQFIKTRFPEEYKLTHISEYSFKKIAIDISLYIYKYKAVNSQTWLTSFINLIACLRRYNVHCIFVYDTSFPELKKIHAHKKREKHRENLQEKIFDLEIGLQHYHNTGEISKEIKSFAEKKGNRAYNVLTENIDMHFIEQEIHKKINQDVHVSQEDFAKTKELFEILNVPFIDAITEGEATCAKMCRVNKVEATLSEDSDLLAYGANIFLSKINVSDGTCIEVNFSNLLEKLTWSRNQFIDFCILCGTDYNDNIPGIGPSSAYNLINYFKSIDKLLKSSENEIKKVGTRIPKQKILDFSVLENYKEIRKILRQPKAKKIIVKYCGNPNYEKLQKFLNENNLNLILERLKSDFSLPSLEFTNK